MGCSATIAVIIENRIFVSNIGDCQAFLCYTAEEEEGDMRVATVSIDHNVDNEDEKLRLQHLGYSEAAAGTSDSGLGNIAVNTPP